MKNTRKILSLILLLVLLLASPLLMVQVNSDCPCEEDSEQTDTEKNTEYSQGAQQSYGPVMPMDPELLEERNRILTEGPFLELEPYVSIDAYTSLISHLDYNPTWRNQGSCGNCWVWAGTGVMEIALSVQEGIRARLSIQNFTSCHNGGANASWACCGGNLGAFATRYSNVGYVIPWNNTNADWYNDGGDRFRGCLSGPTSVPCNTIDTSCNYTITSISAVTIPTYQQPMDTAINNIKNAIDSNKGVYFGYCQGNWSAPGAFYDEWYNFGEDHIWDINQTCSQVWSPPASGCHAVVCLGYNDTDPDPLKHYWIMVNSWGTAGGGRPNGIFLVPMRMNYNCTISDPGNPSVIAFGFETLNVQFDVQTPVADADGPYTGSEGTSVGLDGSGSSDDVGIVAYEWDLDDDGVFDEATGVSPSYTWGDDYSGAVALRVTDDDCLNDTDTSTATIDNVDPSVEAGSNQTVNEGDTVNFQGSFTDPGWLDTHTAEWDWGDGSPPEAGAVTEENVQPDATGTITGSHVYCDNGTYTVTLNVTDDDGGWSTDTLTVTVNNVAPSVEAGSDQTVNEGDTVNLQANFTDPGSCDTHTATIDWGDGSPVELGTVSEENVAPDATGNVTGSHVYCDNGVYVVTVNVTDDDGAWSTDTLTVTVNNVAPEVEAGKPQTVDEGELLLFKGNFTDPGSCDTHTAAWDWDDGSGDPGVVTEENVPPDATGNVTGSHTYCDNGDYDVLLTVTDDDGDTGNDTVKITVLNVPPEITFFNMTYFDSWCDTVEVAFYAEFTDPGWCDTHTAIWDWDDGSTSPGTVTEENIEPDSTGTVTGAHTYTDARNQHYKVTLYVYDDDGGLDTYEYRWIPGPVGGELLPNRIPNLLLLTMLAAVLVIGSKYRKTIPMI